MKKRFVTRTWTTKSGITKTKTYEYGVGKSRRGKVLVSKSGAINKKNVAQLIDEINSNPNYREDQKRALINDLNVLIKQRKKSHKKLTTTGFLGQLEEDSISRLLANAGYSPEEAAQELGVEEEELLKASNWKDNNFTIGGVTYAIKFNYTGSIFERI